MKELIKEEYKFIIFIVTLILLTIISTIKLPYYIIRVGGTYDVNEVIDAEGYESEGSFNLDYVKTAQLTIGKYLFSIFDKDKEIEPLEDILTEDESVEVYKAMNKIELESSISNAIYVAFTKANKEIEILSTEFIIGYIAPDAKTDVEISDEIISIDGKNITLEKELSETLDNIKIGEKINMKVKNNGKTYNRYAYMLEDNNEEHVGIGVYTINKYKMTPKVKIKKEDLGGPSAGLIMSLYIYNKLTKEDITKGKKIVGTGTIDLDGNVGPIGSVEFKLKSAVKENADIFIVPKEENYEEAIKLKKKNKYKIKIIGVSTFDEAIEALKNI